ncbi:glycosyl transferase [Brachybacterium phenoliresistens]|uniref:Glycosyl transferase n=1 Tax=Brachybacterium phenoliresistens TaxID=396014 RepID=Z9JX51_9MICO|nr:glycosyl transferase [Brachybacterium phenoliresistens]
MVLLEPTAVGGLAAHVRQEEALLESAGVRITRPPVRIAPRPGPQDLATVRTLRRILRRPGSGIGAVHAHGLRAAALAGLARGPRGRRPLLVVTLHNRIAGGAGVRIIGAALLRIIRARADAVLTVSPDLATGLDGVPRVLHAIVPAPEPSAPEPSASQPPASEPPAPEAPAGRGTDPAPQPAPSGTGPAPQPAPSARSGPAGLEVLVVARLAPQKGLDVLLDAVRLLVDRRVDVQVRIAGDGPEQSALEARIRAESLPVRLLGRREDVPALLASCDLVVSAARWEGQPVFLQEALRAGRAIVATRAGGTELVTGDAAALVPVEDPAALADAIAAMADPSARRRAAQASARRARELPGAAEMSAQLLEVLGLGPAAGTPPRAAGTPMRDDAP